MSKKSETPASVRVARWAAVAATITALGTIGNTFMEKRPWFLGGDEPTEVVEIRSEPNDKSRGLPETSYFESKEPVHSDAPKTPVRQLHVDATEKVVVASIMPEQQMETAMSIAEEPSFIDKLSYFVERRPFPFWIFVSCVVFGSPWLIIEFLHRRKAKKTIMFDKSNPL